METENISSPRPGLLTLRRVRGESALTYYVYVPTSGVKRETPLFVSVHGISRNAREHCQGFAAVAEREGAVVVSPLFAKDFYPDFQRLGMRSGHRADVALDHVIADARSLFGLSSERFTLFGYSGGGQFAHRYALTHPERIEALAVASPGWYTWPTYDREFPLGLKTNSERRDLVCHLDAFLKIPLCVLVGALDTERDAALRCSRWLDRTQGKNRYQRARRWFKALASLARERGIERRAEFKLLSQSGHDFESNVRADRMDAEVAAFFYGNHRGEHAVTVLEGAKT